jgi:tetratricopeptide (TPR) repeat protein
MPSSDTRDIPHVSIHDHYISKTNAINPNKPKQTMLKQATAIGLHGVNNPNPGTEELFQAYITYFEKFDANALYMKEAKRILSSVNGENEPRLDVIGLEAQIHYLYNQQSFSDMIALWENGASEGQREALLKDAWTQYRVAVAYDKMLPSPSTNSETHKAKAIQYYRNAYEAMPLNTDFLAEYTGAMVRALRTDEAKPLILNGLKHQPKHEQLLMNLGYCHYQEKQWKLAITTYEKALALNPESQATLSLIDLYITVGQKERAKVLYERAKKWADPAILRGWSF